jgi:hypothetical protein
MTYIYNPQQLEASENTFVTALAFASGTGVLTATRNDGVELTADLDGRYATENTHTTSATFNTSDGVLTLNQTDPVGTVTVDLDGRFPTENTHLNSATLGVDNVLSLGMVNPTSTITVDLSDLSDLNTHLDSASFDSSTKILSLVMVNPSSTITVDLSGIEGTNTFVTSATFVDGTLDLNRNDGATVSVDLDGRYATQNTHVDDVTFNNNTRELKVDMVNPTSEFKVTIPGGPDENTFLSSLAMNDNSGDLTATLNNDETVTTNLDGRYNLLSDNTHLNTATFNTDTGVLRLGMVNPASNIDVVIETADQQNTHLDSASLSSENVLQLNMINPSSQITVDLSSVVTGDFLPISFTTAFTGNLNDLTEPGVYSVSSTALNTPPEIQGNEHFVAVYSDRVGTGMPTSCVQIWTTGMNQNDGLNPNTRMWIRIFSSGTTPIVSPWQEINNGALNGYLRGELTATGRDFNHSRYRQSGYYYVGNVNSETSGWSNGPANFPDSQFNVLKTVMLGVSATDLSYGNGHQELSTATYDTPNNHVRTWKRSFEASSTVTNYTEWYEIFHQGIPIELEVQEVTNSIDSRSEIDVSNVRVLNCNLGISYTIRTLTNGVEGQIVTIIKTNRNGFVRVWHWDSFNGGNIVTATGPETAANLRYHRSVAFIKVGQYWYPYNWNNTMS